MKFVLATHNPNKIREMGAILGQFGVEVVSPKELGITVDVEETGSTFAENAMLKAKAICELAKLPAIADDSGLCVDALNGGPVCTPPGTAARGWMTGDGICCCCKLCGADHPGGSFYLRHCLCLPQWGHHHRRGAGSRHHRFCPHGGGRFPAMTPYSSCLTRQRPLHS